MTQNSQLGGRGTASEQTGDRFVKEWWQRDDVLRKSQPLIETPIGSGAGLDHWGTANIGAGSGTAGENLRYPDVEAYRKLK